MEPTLDWVRRIIVHNPFRRSWSVRIGRVRIFSVPWYWDVLRERLAASSTRWRPVAPPPAHHDHYCEECDRQWVHEGNMCATPWAAPCAGERHQGAGKGRRRLGRWFMVVRRDRAELCQQLGESFGGDPRVTVVVDRRQSERRGTRGPDLPVAVERRRRRDRRTPPTDADGPMWANLGFRPHRRRSLGPL
jgi:hypothetical protein